MCVCVQKERGRDFKELAHTTVEADKSDIFKVGQQETQGRLGAVLESDSSLLAESLLLKERLIFLSRPSANWVRPSHSMNCFTRNLPIWILILSKKCFHGNIQMFLSKYLGTIA